jgi:hypothetical protein
LIWEAAVKDETDAAAKFRRPERRIESDNCTDAMPERTEFQLLGDG